MQMSDEDWGALRTEIIEAFTPGTPINETELFAGRPDTIQKLQDIVIEPGRHAIIFGERGVGKTSLANTFYRPLHRANRPVLPVRVNADGADTFDSLWRKVFKRLQKASDDGNSVGADQLHGQALTPDDVVTELGAFTPNSSPIIVIDEFDRLEDDRCKNLTADVVKGLSDFTVNCTVVIVGVAKSVTDLIASHQSITRAMPQVPMRRMNREELSAIVTVRLKRLGMAIDENALWRVSFFSAGLPFYAHSLGKHSAMLAVSERRKKVTEADVFNSMPSFYADVDYSIQEGYVKATEKIYRKDNIFSHVLAACALADMDALGQFTAAAVEAPLSAILGKDYKTPAFAFHLNELSKSARGSILVKSGERRTYRFQFSDARMQPYVVMHCLNQKILTSDVIEQFTIRRQRGFWPTNEPSRP